MIELVIISFLYCFDSVMNIITLGQWEKVRGEERAYKTIKEQN